MKVVCHREGLLAACQIAGAATATRDLKPVLRNLKAIVKEDRCTLMATDLELGIRLEVRGVKVEEPGEALLPTTRMISILRESVDEEMIVEAGPESASSMDSRTSSRCRAKIPRRFRTFLPSRRKSITNSPAACCGR